MRISDWSSDVCSSDELTRRFPDRADHARALPPIARSLHGGVDDRLGGRETWVGVVLLGGVLQEQLGKPFLARSEEHTSELQSLMRISYAVFCLKKQKTKNQLITPWYDQMSKT